MTFQNIMIAILVLLIICLNASEACVDNDVAVYKVKLMFLWSGQSLPTDYLEDAQWSKVFGQSHNKTYALYRVGDPVTALVGDFARTGSVASLLEQGDEEPKVYDQFVAPAVRRGVGDTEGVVFVDGDHSLISLICRMIPSPSWFVGVDSLDLCLDSSWVDQVTLDLDPLDAGTTNVQDSNHDTSWSSNPSKPVERLSILNPESPFSNFYSRKVRHMPAIAKVEFTKIQEYSTKELNDMVRKEFNWNMKSKNNFPGKYQIKPDFARTEEKYEAYKRRIDFTTKNPFEHLKDLEEDPVGTPKPNNPDNIVMVVTKAPKESEEEFEKHLNSMDDVVLAVATGHKLGLRKHLPRHFKSRLHHAVNKNHHYDCIVSEWSEWSSCSDPCSDTGEMIRTRSIVRDRKKGGRRCPDLFEKKSCGHRCRGDVFGW